MNKIPYFETKVVKVKKECKQRCPWWNDAGWCLDCPKSIYQKKGNWVNGENIDKIKFPCFCSYVSHTGKKRYALLNKDKNNGKDEYRLSRIFQDTCSNFFLASDSLKKLIRKWDIKILKGKVIIFEEEE